MRSILADHARRYPDWAAVDVYKLIHQAALGPGHARADEARVRQALRREMAGLAGGPEEPLVDPISPDGRIVRVHLRPFAELHLRQELLVQAFLRTAAEFRPSNDSLIAYASIAAGLIAERTVRFNGGQFAKLMAEMQSGGFPAVHHSPGFVMRYHPAYRVVAREWLPDEVMVAPRRRSGGPSTRPSTG